MSVPKGMTASRSRLAIAHDWLIQPRGAERILNEFCRRLEHTSIYALMCVADDLAPAILRHSVYVSRLNRLPWVGHYYRLLLPFHGRAVEGLQVGSDPEVLLSISHSVAKGIPHEPDLPHICYCLTPMRYVWEREVYGDFLTSAPMRAVMSRFEKRLKAWDLEANRGVSEFVAISETVRGRIRRFYGREATVIFPGTNLERFRPRGRQREDFFLIVSALVPQKRIDLAVEAFNHNGLRLLIVGDGPLRTSLRLRARDNIQFLGALSDREILDYYGRASALIFPGLEDFGLVPVEAQACGCPVLAFRGGGVTETVREGKSGLFFDSQTPDSLNTSLRQLLRQNWSEEEVSAQVSDFSVARFISDWNRFFRKRGFQVQL